MSTSKDKTQKNTQGRKLHWMQLDNAAKIYPAARTRNWSNVFRLSATLTEKVDVEVLQSALNVTVRRFPSIAARLRKGLFWYYIQEVEEAPKIMEESSYPLVKMHKPEVRRCAFRVIVYDKRIAVEIFHSLTDGNGGLVFLKTLIAEYLEQKYGVEIPAEQGVLDRREPPRKEEMEDYFHKVAGRVPASRKETDAYKITGTVEDRERMHLVCLKLPADKVKAMAKQYDVTVSGLFAAILTKAMMDMQRHEVTNFMKQKPIKILIPVDLRRMYGMDSLRNFVLYMITEIDPRLGEYDFKEICYIIKHQMALGVTAKNMSSMIATNVAPDQKFILRLAPLPLKNLVMKAIFNAVGERKSCLSMSNLGKVTVPKPMEQYVERMDFFLSPPATLPYNCGILSYGDTVYVNFLRDIKEPRLELAMHEVMRDMGIVATVESNRGNKE